MDNEIDTLKAEIVRLNAVIARLRADMRNPPSSRERIRRTMAFLKTSTPEQRLEILRASKFPNTV